SVVTALRTFRYSTPSILCFFDMRLLLCEAAQVVSLGRLPVVNLDGSYRRFFRGWRFVGARYLRPDADALDFAVPVWVARGRFVERDLLAGPVLDVVAVHAGDGLAVRRVDREALFGALHVDDGLLGLAPALADKVAADYLRNGHGHVLVLQIPGADVVLVVQRAVISRHSSLRSRSRF